MLQGLRTTIYPVSDFASAKSWYSRVLGLDPYFDQPFYVGFNVGGFELGLDPNGSLATEGGGPTAYWGVDDAGSALARLLELGAKPHHELQDVGGGIRVAAVKDPFGNVFGIIENPHFRIADPSQHSH
jgi:predicted enzyme related to lactoylglutathione lyase